MKMKRYEPKKAHEIVDTIQKRLTAEERDFWWRLTHKLISILDEEDREQVEETPERRTGGEHMPSV